MRTENLAGEPVDLLGWGARDMSAGAKARNIANQLAAMKAEQLRQEQDLANQNKIIAQRNAMIRAATAAKAASARGAAQSAALENARSEHLDAASAAPVDTSLPQDAAPQDAAPQDAAPADASPELLGIDLKKNLPIIAIAAGAGFLFFTKTGKKLLRKIR
jgi:hypothetical protein